MERMTAAQFQARRAGSRGSRPRPRATGPSWPRRRRPPSGSSTRRSGSGRAGPAQHPAEGRQAGVRLRPHQSRSSTTASRRWRPTACKMQGVALAGPARASPSCRFSSAISRRDRARHPREHDLRPAVRAGHSGAAIMGGEGNAFIRSSAARGGSCSPPPRSCWARSSASCSRATTRSASPSQS
jgi:hypothetical protein